nr:uncharacterized protein LOC129440737 [Misgurnus anguillicaudatus]
MKQLCLYILSFSGLLSVALCKHREYILIKELKTWTDAQTYCKINHLDLATIQTAEDLTCLQEVALKSTFTLAAWIGLYNDINSWRWSYQDESLNFTKWYPGDPDNAGTGEECAVLRAEGYWFDRYCTYTRDFLCFDGAAMSIGVLAHSTSKGNTSRALGQGATLTDIYRAAGWVTPREMKGLVPAAKLMLSALNTSPGSRLRCCRWRSGGSSGLTQRHDVMDRLGLLLCGRKLLDEDFDCIAKEAGLGYGDRKPSVKRLQNSTVEYHLINQLKMWKEAQQYCRDQYIDLVTIRNETEQELLTNLMYLSGGVWIGLFRDSWKWSDQSSLSSSNQLAVESLNGANENCATTNFNGNFEDWLCSTTFYFYCNTVNKKRQIVRVQLKSNVDNMSDVQLKTRVLQKLRQNLSDLMVDGELTLTWRKQLNGKVFQKRKSSL